MDAAIDQCRKAAAVAQTPLSQKKTIEHKIDEILKQESTMDLSQMPFIKTLY